MLERLSLRKENEGGYTYSATNVDFNLNVKLQVSTSAFKFSLRRSKSNGLKDY